MYKAFFKLLLLSIIVVAQNPHQNKPELEKIETEALTEPLISMDPNDVRFYIYPSRKYAQSFEKSALIMKNCN